MREILVSMQRKRGISRKSKDEEWTVGRMYIRDYEEEFYEKPLRKTEEPKIICWRRTKEQVIEHK
jgi:hypothetical protein